MNREQLAKECKEIEKAGGSVLDFLRLRGCISPWGTWYRLQKEELNRAEHQITDGKGVGDMRKITLEQKKKAVEIAISGGDPLEYLGECGSESPDKLWWYIKNCLKKSQPDLYAQIPSGRKKAAEKPKNEPKTLDGSAWEPYKVEEPEKPAATCCARSTRKGVEVPDEIQDLEVTEVAEPPKPITDLTILADGDDFQIYGLKSKIGDFQAAGGQLCWYKTENQMVSMPVEDWKKILEVVPRVLEVMKL